MAGKISAGTRDKVEELYSSGKSNRQIADELGISVTSVARIIQGAKGKTEPQSGKVEPTIDKSPAPSKNVQKKDENTPDGNYVEIPRDSIDRMMKSLIEVLKDNLSQSLDGTVSRFTTENLKKFFTMLEDEDKARSEIESLNSEIERLNRVKNQLDSEILDAVMRMSAIESRIINIEKRFGVSSGRDENDL